ncbi:9740_t:CDS:1, partial [Cetraspora pellucida]
ATDSQCYNVPNASEITAIIVGDNYSKAGLSNQDIILYLHLEGLQCISELHRAYILLHYVLLFPRGEDGWHLEIPIHNDASIFSSYQEQQELDDDDINQKTITMMQYYSYRLQVSRFNEGINIHLFGCLF